MKTQPVRHRVRQRPPKKRMVRRIRKMRWAVVRLFGGGGATAGYDSAASYGGGGDYSAGAADCGDGGGGGDC